MPTRPSSQPPRIRRPRISFRKRRELSANLLAGFLEAPEGLFLRVADRQRQIDLLQFPENMTGHYVSEDSPRSYAATVVAGKAHDGLLETMETREGIIRHHRIDEADGAARSTKTDLGALKHDNASSSLGRMQELPKAR